MAYRRGDVVLVPFPFSDLGTTKTRPAAVVSVSEFEQATGDLTVAMITSVKQPTRFDTSLADWREAKLLYPSWARAKLVTLSPNLIRCRLGQLSSRDLKELARRRQRALGLQEA